MLRKSVYTFRIAFLITVVGAILYFLNSDYHEIGKYIIGAGLVITAVSSIFYIFFMFTRYGDKDKN